MRSLLNRLVVLVSFTLAACGACAEQNRMPETPPAPEKPDFGQNAQTQTLGGAPSNVSGTGSPVLPPMSPEVSPLPGDSLDYPCTWPQDHRPDVVIQPASEKGPQDVVYSNGGFYAMQLRIDPCPQTGGVLESAVVSLGGQGNATSLVTGFGLRKVVVHEWILGGFQPQGSYVPLYDNQGANSRTLGRNTGNNFYELVGWVDPARISVPLEFKVGLKGWYFTYYDPQTGQTRPARVWNSERLARRMEFNRIL